MHPSSRPLALFTLFAACGPALGLGLFGGHPPANPTPPTTCVQCPCGDGDSAANAEFSRLIDASIVTMQTLNSSILRLSDDIGEMADRILETEDKIGEMADRIITTEELLAQTLLQLAGVQPGLSPVFICTQPPQGSQTGGMVCVQAGAGSS